MKVIGLCGGSGSGKGYVASLFATHSIVSIDTDAVYRELVSGHSDCMSELIAEFGRGIATPGGALDREAMRGLVFSGEGAELNRARLNEISHRHVLSEVRRRILELDRGGAAAVIVDVPLLFESGFDKECDFIICVVAPVEVRLRRIMDRDGIKREAAMARIAVQLSDDALIRRSDFVINNSGENTEILEDINRICDTVLKK